MHGPKMPICFAAYSVYLGHFLICIQSFYQIKRPHLVGNEWTDYVQQLVDFAHAFPRFSVMNNKSRPCILEFLPNIFRVLEGLAGYPTVMLVRRINHIKSTTTKCGIISIHGRHVLTRVT